MRRRVFLTVAAAGGVLGAASSSPEEPRGARIRVEPEGFDFGRVRPRRTLRKEFRLRNLGDRELVIERITRSCGCTAATADDLTLAPGASTPLRVAVETRESSGPVEHRVLVRTNDPETPSLEIRLRATVVAETP